MKGPSSVKIMKKMSKKIVTKYTQCKWIIISIAISVMTYNAESKELVNEMLIIVKKRIKYLLLFHHLINTVALTLGRERRGLVYKCVFEIHERRRCQKRKDVLEV